MRAEQVVTTHPTPGREVTVAFNHAEDVVTERGFRERRTGAQIIPKTANATNVEKLATGLWVLKPRQALNQLHESEDLHAFQLRRSQCSVASHVQEITFQRRYSEFTGIGVDTAVVAAAGDYYMIKRVQAGATWNNVVVSGPAAPTLPSANYPLDRVMVGPTNGPIPEGNTGWILKVRVPGAVGQTVDFFAGFRFGGPQLGTDPNGYGLFYLAFGGDGTALLYEFIDGAWALVSRWRWGTPSETPTLMLVCRILPHGSRHIEFSTFNAGLFTRPIDVATSTAMHLLRANFQESEPKGTHAYYAANHDAVAELLEADDLPLTVTGPGYCAVDIRRDLRAMWQVSRIVYPESGELWDEPMTIPYGYEDAHVLTIQTEGENMQQAGTLLANLAAEIEEADGDALTPDTETYTLGGVSHTLDGWNPPGGANQVRAHFLFTNEQDTDVNYQTPTLAAYTIQRRPHIEEVTPTPFEAPTVLSVSITGPGTDPDQESAHVAIEDLTGSLDLLRTYGRQPVRITTSYPGQGMSDPDVILFEGYVGRATARRKGKTGKTFPAADWHRFDVEMLGKWDRISASTFKERFNFGDAVTSPTGVSADPVNDPAWLVTDILRVLLEHAGFPDAQVYVPSSPMRLFATGNMSKEDAFTTTPGAFIHDTLRRLCTFYLNSFFLWDANAGEKGQWWVRTPPTGTAPTALWTFTTAAPVSMRLPHLSVSYGSETSPILNLLDEYVVSPEFSALTVRGGPTHRQDGRASVFEQTFINPKSYSAPTHPASADETDPDYLPRLVEVLYHDPTLRTPRAVRFIGRRLLNLAGRGQKWRSFIAETVLLDAAALDAARYTTRLKRPLLPGDVVMMDSDRYVIRSNSPAFRKSGIMLSHYEAMLYRTDVTWG